MATALDVNKAEALIQSVVESNSLSDFWNPSVDKVTYYILNELFDFIEKISFSTAAVKPSITLLCGRNTDSIVKNVFNLKRKVNNYLKKNSKQCILFIKSCIFQILMIVSQILMLVCLVLILLEITV